ncbi:PilI type IV pilus biogenesis protein [Escherichia coli]|nr:PilI type IV pilus biogenesis protein [Escherichia coli]
MPQQHPGRLQVLVVDTHCKRRLFSTKTPTDPDELARRFCTPDNCLVVVGVRLENGKYPTLRLFSIQ